MKLYTTICVLLIGSLISGSKAFAAVGPIVVTANENFTVTLFFPSEIDKVVAPANNFKFDYKVNENLGTLTARKGTNSNLTVITTDGLIFSFTLNYSERIENFTYVLSKDQAAGRLASKGSRGVVTQKSMPTSTDAFSSKAEPLYSKALKDKTGVLSVNKKAGEHTLYEMDRLEYYRIFCENNYMQAARVKDMHTEIGGVQMSVKSIIRDRNEVYITLEVSNQLETQYFMKEPQFFVKTRENRAPMKIQSLYSFNYQKVVGSRSQTSMVYVFKDFSLGNDQQVYVLVDSLENKKQLVLPLDKSLF